MDGFSHQRKELNRRDNHEGGLFDLDEPSFRTVRDNIYGYNSFNSMDIFRRYRSSQRSSNTLMQLESFASNMYNSLFNIRVAFEGFVDANERETELPTRTPCPPHREERRLFNMSFATEEREPESPTHTASIRESTEIQASSNNILHTIVYNGKGDSTCLICRDEFKEGKNIKILSGCFHRYHPACINKWLKVKQICPVCRCKVG